MKAAIDRHFVQNRTKFDAEMMKYCRLVLQLPTGTGIRCCTVDHDDNLSI